MELRSISSQIHILIMFLKALLIGSYSYQKQQLATIVIYYLNCWSTLHCTGISSLVLVYLLLIHYYDQLTIIAMNWCGLKRIPYKPLIWEMVVAWVILHWFYNNWSMILYVEIRPTLAFIKITILRYMHKAVAIRFSHALSPARTYRYCTCTAIVDWMWHTIWA